MLLQTLLLQEKNEKFSLKPIKIKIGAINSEKTARNNVGASRFQLIRKFEVTSD